MTTCALIGTGLEIIRFPELFMYAVRLGSVKSQAEISSVRKAIVLEFPFGVNYAWMLLVFAVTVSYSVMRSSTSTMLLYLLIERFNVPDPELSDKSEDREMDVTDSFVKRDMPSGSENIPR